MPDRCLIYCRVSTDEQGRGYSLPTQRESCERHAAARGYVVLDAFQDTHTGTTLDRPGLQACIAAVAELRPDVVLLHDVDRLGREIIVQAIAEQELTRHGGRVEYVLGGDTDGADGILLKGVKQALAVYENYQRVERSRRGKNGRVQAGGVLVAARPAYGYRYVAGKTAEGRKTGRLEPDPDEAPVVVMIYRWCADEGLTCYEIAKRLCAAGVPTRGDVSGVVVKRAERHFWDPHTVSRILRNETHRGAWHWGKRRTVKRGDKRVQERRPREEWLTVAVPPLVDEATWLRAQAQLDRNKANARRNARREYLLRGLVFCPSCGRRWVGRYKNHLDRAYYRCPTTEGEPWRRDCAARFGIEQTRIEAAVLGAVKAYLLDPESRAAGEAAERERSARARRPLGHDLAAAERALADVDRRLGGLLNDAITGGMPPAVLAERKRILLAERQRRVAELDAARSAVAGADAPDADAVIAALAPMVEAAFAAGTPGELRRLLDVLRLEVRPIDRETVRVTGIVGGEAGSVLTLSPSQTPRNRPAGLGFALDVRLGASGYRPSP